MPAALAKSVATPRAGSQRRLAATALAVLFIAAAGPASAGSAVDHPELVAGDGASSRRTAERAERLGATVPWLLHVRAFIDTVGVSVAQLADPARGVVAPVQARDMELRPRPRRGPFSMNLYSEGDFVNQKTTYWCIPASTQTMMNIMDDGRPNRSTSVAGTTLSGR